MKGIFDELESGIREKERYPIYMFLQFENILQNMDKVLAYHATVHICTKVIMYISVYYDNLYIYCKRYFLSLCSYIHEVYSVQYSHLCQMVIYLKTKNLQIAYYFVSRQFKL